MTDMGSSYGVELRFEMHDSHSKTWLARVHEILAKVATEYQATDCFVGEK